MGLRTSVSNWIRGGNRAATHAVSQSTVPPTAPKFQSNEPVEFEAATTTTPRLTPRALARRLVREFPDGVDVDTLWERSAAVGLDPVDVDLALDAIEESARVVKQTVDEESLRIIDLRELDSTRLRIKGTAYCLHTSERHRYGSTQYLLIREPDNKNDAHAVAVYGRGRKVGYISAAKAATFAPLLDVLGADAFRVSGVGTSVRSVRMWVDLPRIPALRTFVAEQS